MSYISLRFQIMPFHKFFKTLFLLTFLILPAWPGFQFDPWPETQYGIHHTVQKGQTLYRIAQAYKINMEVILLENIKNLGNIGDVVNVKRGHGRNFLIKYGKALKASKENIAFVNKKKI